MPESSRPPATGRRAPRSSVPSQFTHGMTEDTQSTSEVYKSCVTTNAVGSDDAPYFRDLSSQAFLHRRTAKWHTGSRNFVEAITHHEASVQLVETLLTEKGPSHGGSRTRIPSDKEIASRDTPAALACSCLPIVDLRERKSCTVHLTSRNRPLEPYHLPLQTPLPHGNATHRLRMLLSAGLHDLAQIHSFLGDGESAKGCLERALSVLESSTQRDEKVRFYFQALLNTLRARHARGFDKRHAAETQSNHCFDGPRQNSGNVRDAQNSDAKCAPEGNALANPPTAPHACHPGMRACQIGTTEPLKATGPWINHTTDPASSLLGESATAVAACGAASSSTRTWKGSRGSVLNDSSALRRRLSVRRGRGLSTTEEKPPCSCEGTECDAIKDSNSQCTRAGSKSRSRFHPWHFATTWDTLDVGVSTEASGRITEQSRLACTAPCIATLTAPDTSKVSEQVSSAAQTARKPIAGVLVQAHLFESVTESTSKAGKTVSSRSGEARTQRLQPAKDTESFFLPVGSNNRPKQVSDYFPTERSSDEDCESVPSSEGNQHGGRHTVKDTYQKKRHRRLPSTQDFLPGTDNCVNVDANPLSHGKYAACLDPPPSLIWKPHSTGATALASRFDPAEAPASTCHFSGFSDILMWRRAAAKAAVPAKTPSNGHNSSGGGTHEYTSAQREWGDRGDTDINVNSTEQPTVVCTVEKRRCACLVSFHEDDTWQVQVCPVLTRRRQSVRHCSSVGGPTHRDELPCQLRITGTVNGLSLSIRHAAIEKSSLRDVIDPPPDVKSSAAVIIPKKASRNMIEVCPNSDADAVYMLNESTSLFAPVPDTASTDHHPHEQV